MKIMKEAIYSITGTIIYCSLMLVDAVQTLLGIQAKKRPLTAQERDILQRVFGNSLHYDRIRIATGKAGLFSTLNTQSRPFVIGYNIYMLKHFSVSTLVHECVHVWQYQHGGTRYIGNSALHQLYARFIDKRYDPYCWKEPLRACGGDWQALPCVEAQAQFIQDVFELGKFRYSNPGKSAEKGQGAFFRETTTDGCREFRYENEDCTTAADRAWEIIRQG
jgi:hypothetical protein